MAKPLPHLTDDEAAERFVDEADLSEFDLSTLAAHRFEFGIAKVEFASEKPG